MFKQVNLQMHKVWRKLIWGRAESLLSPGCNHLKTFFKKNNVCRKDLR